MLLTRHHVSAVGRGVRSVHRSFVAVNQSTKCAGSRIRRCHSDLGGPIASLPTGKRFSLSNMAAGGKKAAGQVIHSDRVSSLVVLSDRKPGENFSDQRRMRVSRRFQVMFGWRWRLSLFPTVNTVTHLILVFQLPNLHSVWLRNRKWPHSYSFIQQQIPYSWVSSVLIKPVVGSHSNMTLRCGWLPTVCFECRRQSQRGLKDNNHERVATPKDTPDTLGRIDVWNNGTTTVCRCGTWVPIGDVESGSLCRSGTWFLSVDVQSRFFYIIKYNIIN